MYSRSRATHESNCLSFRMLTCQRPVIPGFIESRRRCHGSYCSTSLRSAGRGPTRLMSPFRTFQSCGSSSRLVARKTRPSGVTRGSREALKTGPSRSLRSATSPRRRSASTTIVRNFQSVNVRPLQTDPWLSEQDGSAVAQEDAECDQGAQRSQHDQSGRCHQKIDEAFASGGQRLVRCRNEAQHRNAGEVVEATT